MDYGFVKFDRKIKDWGWYTDIKTFKLFFHFILCASHKDGFFLGKEIKRGQIARSIGSLAKETGLTVQEVRTAIKHLELTREITSEQQGKFSVFTVVNYNLYQAEQQGTNKELTNEQQGANKELTSEQQRVNNIQECKECKECKEIDIDLSRTRRAKRTYGEYKNVLLKDEEIEKLKTEYGTGKTEQAIKYLDEYIEMKGYKAKSHYLAIKKWVFDALKERKNNVKVDELHSRDYSDVYVAPSVLEV